MSFEKLICLIIAAGTIAICLFVLFFILVVIISARKIKDSDKKDIPD
jgi:hypothetical protein